MTDYSKMSDQQINEAVLEALYGGGPEYRATDDGKLIILRHVNTVEFGEHVERTEDAGEFNPCNSWADAGPIIEKNRISIEFDGDDTAQWCHTISCEGLYGIEYQSNPLRAAMITFLLMQEKP